ncbi:hypothetical protein [Bradyrhizobium elkanii]|uniref:Uncharacterized protein (DUF2267 family) n=1 Tax=Bradyrhizobium elkanii TaxID=29448 RepID=A0A7Y8QXE9_BRAEL|nr:hypothetical protein [Bradyrhizobium elkanii]MBP1296504.1 uncharacterized protein (DUF2267 family) [Bradyrhizobium elkanii]MCP1749611.1 uncharacterized protein (DUF2267 family) [Bradyrhizobium elkanii]MCP1984183.1 uncharacterized protein (DUF2267 family) [Bradyrhizobium elkanii]MCS3890095.1 uncharacterized protein (DUF2267 family) [Bradyrhizobium elkanii]MCS4210883.1 uncharacterized protein (DUF2267 family) [Bradyrhizobium elkanii]
MPSIRSRRFAEQSQDVAAQLRTAFRRRAWRGLRQVPPRKRARWCFFVRCAKPVRSRIKCDFASAIAAIDAVMHKRSSAWLKFRPDVGAACGPVGFGRLETC